MALRSLFPRAHPVLLLPNKNVAATPGRAGLVGLWIRMNGSANASLKITSLMDCWALWELLAPRSCSTFRCPKLPPISPINGQETVPVPEGLALLLLGRGFLFCWCWCLLPQCHVAAHSRHTQACCASCQEDSDLPQNQDLPGPPTLNSLTVMDRKQGNTPESYSAWGFLSIRLGLCFRPIVVARDSQS